MTNQLSLICKFFFLFYLSTNILPTTAFAASKSCVLIVRTYDPNILELVLNRSTCSDQALSRFKSALDEASLNRFEGLMGISDEIVARNVDSDRCESGHCLPCSSVETNQCGEFKRLPTNVAHISLDLAGDVLQDQPKASIPKGARILSAQTSEVVSYGISSVIFSDGFSGDLAEFTNSAMKVGLSYVSIKHNAAAIKNDLGLIKRSWEVIFNGGSDPDLKSEWLIKQQRRLYSKLFQDAVNDIDQATRDSSEQVDWLQNQFKWSNRQSSYNFQDINFQSSLQSSLTKGIGQTLTESSLLLTELSRNTAASSETDGSDSLAQQGSLPKEHVLKIQSELENLLQNGGTSEIAQKISYYQGKVSSTSNPIRKNQYQNALRTLTDYRGLVKGWASLVGLPPELQLNTSEFSRQGRALRENINKTLGAIINSEVDSEAGHASLEMLLKADQFYNDEQDIPLKGDRYLNRARSLIEFQSNSPAAVRYKNHKLSENASKRFGLDTSQKSDTYFSYQKNKAINELAEIPEERLDDNQSLLLRLNVANLVQYEREGDLKKFNITLENSYSLLDYAKGFGTGVYKGFEGLWTNAADLLEHPIDSIEAIFWAVTNYDQTTTIMIDALYQYGKDFELASPIEKADMIGQISFDIVSSLVGGSGIGKIGGKIAQLAKLPGMRSGVSELLPKVNKVASSARKSGLGDKIGKTLGSATEPAKPGSDLTKLGHAYQKHGNRHPDRWGKVTGSNVSKNEVGMKHFNDVLDGPGEFKPITTSEGKTFLEKRLPDGRGVRLNQDGTFKGFLDPE